MGRGFSAGPLQAGSLGMGVWGRDNPPLLPRSTHSAAQGDGKMGWERALRGAPCGAQVGRNLPFLPHLWHVCSGQVELVRDRTLKANAGRLITSRGSFYFHNVPVQAA